MAKPILSQEYVKSRFEYKDGNLYHKPMTKENARKKQWNAKHSGKRLGCIDSHGYVSTCLSIDGKPWHFSVHRLIFLYHHGYLPEYIDHIDGDRSNNLIENLRSATKIDNSKNTKLSSRNRYGKPGVYETPSGKWIARINQNKKRINLGTYETLDEAIHAREKAEKLYGYHQNHGRTCL